MRIERVNDSTIKLFITYQDIESRGYKRDDLWTNRKKGEEFFWSIMDEVNHDQKDDFVFDGPLWIQVHAYDKGVEVVVSKSEEETTGVDSSMEKERNDIESLLEEAIKNNDSEVPYISEPITIKFNDFELLVDYSHQVEVDETIYEDLLYVYNNQYYYQIIFDHRVDFDTAEGIESNLLEYGELAMDSSEIIEDYGKIIMSHNVRRQVRKYFTNN